VLITINQSGALPPSTAFSRSQRTFSLLTTLKQIYYLECATNKIKIASHVQFDEGMNDLPLDQLPPFARHLRHALGHATFDDESEIGTPADLDIFSSSVLFPVTFTHTFRVLPSDITNENDTMGFLLQPIEGGMRPYIMGIMPQSTASQFPCWHTTLIGAYILSVHGTPVTSMSEVTAALSSILVDASAVDNHTVTISFMIDSNYRQDSLHTMTNSALQADQICWVATVLSVATTNVPDTHNIHDSGEFLKDLPHLDDTFASHLEDIMCHPSLLANVPGVSIKQLLDTAPKLTRHILLGRSNWSEWHAAEHAQLDAHHKHRTFGSPMACPKICTALRAVWNYILNGMGIKRLASVVMVILCVYEVWV